MSATPDISIVIVTYNAAGTLQACLDSIYRQQYPSLKIIIIDGNSTDSTVDIVKANLNKIYYWKSEPDNGIYDAMNKAIKQLAGDWVYFLGSDDELYDDFSKLAYDLKEPNAIYYANVRTRGVLRSGELDAYNHAKHGVFHQAMIYPAAVFKKYTYDQRYHVHADYALNMALWKDKDFKFIYKDYVIAHFNHTGHSGTRKDDDFEQDKSRLIRENFGLAIWFRFLIRNLKNRH